MSAYLQAAIHSIAEALQSSGAEAEGFRVASQLSSYLMAFEENGGSPSPHPGLGDCNEHLMHSLRDCHALHPHETSANRDATEQRSSESKASCSERSQLGVGRITEM